MDTSQNTKDKFLNEVCKHVTSTVEHKKIRQELSDHIEDSLQHDDLENTLLNLGDPESIGNALNDIYKPWIGRLWRLSIIVIVILSLVLAFSLSQSSEKVDLQSVTHFTSLVTNDSQEFDSNGVNIYGTQVFLRSILKTREEIQLNFHIYENLISPGLVIDDFSELVINGESVGFRFSEESSIPVTRLILISDKYFDEIESLSIRVVGELVQITPRNEDTQ